MKCYLCVLVYVIRAARAFSSVQSQLDAARKDCVLLITRDSVLRENTVYYGTELTLYPYPVEEAPWRFTGWLGDDASLVVDGVVEMTDDVALGAGFTPEWALVLEDPGITADPEPYYTGRYLDGGKGTLIRLQASDLRLQEEIFRQQASDYRPQASGRRFRCSPRPRVSGSPPGHSGFRSAPALFLRSLPIAPSFCTPGTSPLSPAQLCSLSSPMTPPSAPPLKNP